MSERRFGPPPPTREELEAGMKPFVLAAEEALNPKRAKSTHVGAPAAFSLELACQHLNEAFGAHCYVVGSALERADWRDVDVRMIMSDDAFAVLFPDAGDHWEFDPRWLVMTVAISGWLSKLTGLPIDFQFQPQTHANKRHAGNRSAAGLRFTKAAASPAPAHAGEEK